MTPSRAAVVLAFVSVTCILAWAVLSATRSDRSTRIDRSAKVGVGVRTSHIRERSEAAYDDAYETCLAAGIASLARRLEVPDPTPRTVARAFASGWDPAFRSGPYRGCLAALRTTP